MKQHLVSDSGTIWYRKPMAKEPPLPAANRPSRSGDPPAKMVPCGTDKLWYYGVPNQQFCDEIKAVAIRSPPQSKKKFGKSEC